jgi:hypothetical protein
MVTACEVADIALVQFGGGIEFGMAFRGGIGADTADSPRPCLAAL